MLWSTHFQWLKKAARSILFKNFIQYLLFKATSCNRCDCKKVWRTSKRGVFFSDDNPPRERRLGTCVQTSGCQASAGWRLRGLPITLSIETTAFDTHILIFSRTEWFQTSWYEVPLIHNKMLCFVFISEYSNIFLSSINFVDTSGWPMQWWPVSLGKPIECKEAPDMSVAAL